MATTPTLTDRIDQELDALLAELRDLSTVVSEWADLPQPTRASIALDWDHLLLGVLRDVQHFEQRSALNEGQGECLREVYELLNDMRPNLERLGFPVPTALPAS